MVNSAGGLVFVGLELDVDCLFSFYEFRWNLVFFFHETILVPFADIIDLGKLSVVDYDCHIADTVLVTPVADTESKVVTITRIHLVGEESPIGGIAPRLAIEVTAS